MNRQNEAFILTRSVIKEMHQNENQNERTAYLITPHDINLIRDLRHVMRENQTQFWSRFGVTQTQGSRFERSREMPLPVLMLLRLYLLHIISDKHLRRVRSPDFVNE